MRTIRKVTVFRTGLDRDQLSCSDTNTRRDRLLVEWFYLTVLCWVFPRVGFCDLVTDSLSNLHHILLVMSSSPVVACRAVIFAALKNRRDLARK